jgi:L-alanine-DL-glutamate epimerase-like enolase superfamily enzyme
VGVSAAPVIERVAGRAFRFPTDAPEADGTLTWRHTTIVIAEASAADVTGLGYTYAAVEAAELINDTLAEVVVGEDAFATPKSWEAMVRSVRNVGWRGIGATAISAVDVALWDLKARLLDRPLVQLLGATRSAVPIYGSGGFTSYSPQRLSEQLAAWVTQDGCQWVKMKVGSEPVQDLQRVRAARSAIGAAGLFVDANGAYSRKQALRFAEQFAELDVSWFEEPVSSDDLNGLRLLRDRAPPAMEIAAGEYGYEPFYFRRMLQAGAVDVLQADATRCCGITGFLRAAAIADAYMVPLSSHTAPALHLHVCCAAPRLRHIEWFHDHVRIERTLFDGAPVPKQGLIRPDLSRAGLGLELRGADAERFAA